MEPTEKTTRKRPPFRADHVGSFLRPPGLIAASERHREGEIDAAALRAAEGGYEPLAEALLDELAVDGYFLEYDDARSGGFAPLRFTPAGKTVVLGLVSTKLGSFESKDELLRRIDEAARQGRGSP